MRFVLREYLTTLKEEGELDSFVRELIITMRVIPLSKTQKGRQDGVDVAGVGRDEDGERKVFLFVIKQGNFSRTTWNSGKLNDIKVSLDEVNIVYISTRIPPTFNQLKKKIIVCCNGYLEQTVDQTWAQYIHQNQKTDIEYDFWGVDKLVALAELHQFNEAFLPNDQALNFRRALSFLDLPDYNLSHFYRFLDGLFEGEEKINARLAIKKIRLVNLCFSIIQSWCEKSDNVKPAFYAGERIILNTWGWLVKHKLNDDKTVFLAFYFIILNWRDLGLKYVLKVHQFFDIKYGLSLGVPEHNEYCLLTYEEIGIISTIGLFQVWSCRVGLISDDSKAIQSTEEAYSIACSLADKLASLIKNNPSSFSPRFDEHLIEINSALILLYETERFNVAVSWLESIISYLNINFLFGKFFPLFYTDLNKLAAGEYKLQTSSHIIVLLAEWCVILKQPELYLTLLSIVKRNFPDMELQLWMPEKNIDQKIFISNASQDFGATLVNIKMPENIKELEMIMAEERLLFKDEVDSSMYKCGVDFLAFIAFRHFRTYPFANTWRKLLATSFCFNA